MASSRSTMERRIHGNDSSAGPARLREQVAEKLERLSRLLMWHARQPAATEAAPAIDQAEIARAQQMVRFLGQIAAGWPHLPSDALPAKGAGFGSTVVVEDVERAGAEKFTLMSSPILDLDAGHVSLASPIGQALLGARPGDMVVVDTPQRRRTVRVLGVRTLEERLRERVPGPPV
jgi:transcription elongation GreA/GreB family factor